MITETAALARRLAEVLPADRIGTDRRIVQSNSQDYAWFSNILEEDLGGCCADVVAWPVDERELADVLAASYETRTPVTVRGGGTGNYGQCVPLRGGLVVNMGRMARVVELGEGYARVQAGVRFVELDQAAAPSGQEVHIYPSTYLTATVAGFICGGSGGVGSIRHGPIVDGNVVGATVYPVSGAPAPTSVAGAELGTLIHAYGTTGVLSDVTVPLAPRRTWQQATYSFRDIFACHAFCLELIADEAVIKRLICTAEPGVVRHFMRARLPFKPDRTAALLMCNAEALDRVTALAARHGGELDFALPLDSKSRLTDFTWNHTTLWAKKADDSLTYLQAGFDIARYEEQVRAIKLEYGDAFAIHHEYFLVGGAPFAGSLPIVPYQGRAAMDRMVEFLESIGIGIANPHRFILEEGSRVDNVDELLAAKRRNDPAGLLNPGKFRAAFAEGETPAHSFKAASMSLARRRAL